MTKDSERLPGINNQHFGTKDDPYSVMRKKESTEQINLLDTRDKYNVSRGASDLREVTENIPKYPPRHSSVPAASIKQNTLEGIKPVHQNSASISSNPDQTIITPQFLNTADKPSEKTNNANSPWKGRPVTKKIPTHRRPYRFDLLTWIGEIFITLGLLGGLLAFWDVFVTDWQVRDFNNAAIKEFNQGKKCVSRVSNDIRKDQPPIPVPGPLGNPLALLHYPTWNYMIIPVRQGAEQYIVDTGAAGHYAETALPGEIGNFSVAAHRRSYGSNFRRVDTLKAGDPVVVETDKAWMVYKVYKYEIVSPSAGEVIAPVPGEPGKTPTERLMTMTTCNPEYGNWQRYIVHLKFDHWIPRESGIPKELAGPGGQQACTN